MNVSDITHNNLPEAVGGLYKEIGQLREELSRLTVQTKDDEVYMSRTQVAELLGLSLPTISGMTDRGELKGYRVGGRIRYKKSEIDNALEPIT